MLAVIRGVGVSMGGSKHGPPFVSHRYQLINTHDTKQAGLFPYDVPFLKPREVRDLVELSKQYFYSEMVVLRLQQHQDFPDALIDRLKPLHSLRFFHEELDFELRKLLTPVEFTQWGTVLFAYCGDFSRLQTPLWTWDRAKAHLQKNNPLLRRASASDYLWSVWQRYEDHGQRMTARQLFQYAAAHQLGQNLTPPMWMQHNSRVTGISADVLWEQEIKKQGLDIHALRQTHFDLLQELQTSEQ